MLFINDTLKGSTNMVLLFVVPACKHQAVLDLCHHDVGHQGRDRTYSLLQERFWWPKMRMQMMMTLQNCEKCKVYEKKDPKVPLCSIAAMDLVNVDLVRMEVTVETKKKPMVQKILVVTDHFSRFVQAYKVKDKRAITIAKCLYDNYFRHYGFPHHLLSDQGTEFCNAILNEMCIYLNIKKLRMSPYHPQTNGTIESVHQTLEWMITKLDSKWCRKWPEHLSSITHAYNSTRSQITGYSPYFLMMGHRPQLPIDLLFPTARTLPGTKGLKEYIKALYGRLREASKLAHVSADQEAAWHKHLHDRRAGVTATQLAIQVSMLVLEPLPNGEERSRVPYEWSIDGYSLNLASFQLMLNAPEPKTGPPALAALAEVLLKEGVGQRRDNGKGNNSTRDGNAIPVEDTPPWTGTH